MKSITLRNFRGVTSSTVDFSDGVTVIVGANEVGKSSIAQAIVLLREAKASSRTKHIMAVQPVHRDVGPEVELSLATGDYDLTYRKRWIKQPLTELQIHAPRKHQFTGDEAHERFGTILEETCDTDLLEALELVQGQSLEQPDLARITALHRALDGTAGEFESHDELLARLDQEYARYFTPTGRPTGDYKLISERLDELHHDIAELQSKSEEMDGFALEHQMHSENLEKFAEDLRKAQNEARRLEQESKKLAGLREAVEMASHQQKLYERHLKEARAALEARVALVQEADERGHDATTLLEQAHQSDVLEKQRRVEAEQARNELDVAEAEHRDAREAARDASALVNQLRDHTELDQATQRLTQARIAEGRRRSARAVLDTNTMDQATLDRLAKLDNELKVADAVRAGAAPSLTVETLGEHPVLLDGTPSGDSAESLVSEPITIEVPGVVRVMVRPGETPSDLDRSWREARDALESALSSSAVTCVTQAHELAQMRRDAQEELNHAEAALSTLLPDVSLSELEEQVTSLRTRLGGDPPDDHTDRDALDQAALRAQHALEAAEKAMAAAREVADTCNKDYDEARIGRAELVAKAAGAGQEAGRVEARLVAARETTTDAALETAVLDAERELDAAQLRVRAAEIELAEAAPEILQMELTNAQDRLARAHRETDGATKRLTELGALLDDRATLGIYDQLANAKAERETLQSRHMRIQRQAEAVRLLRDAMNRHRQVAQQSYVAPFRERIERLGRLVFGPDFAVEISTDLVIDNRTLNGITVPFESLSSGAKEQLSLLGRLACAQLIDDEQGAPVILDDALGFADEQRLNALGVVLNDVGKTAQVIILTCQAERYASLGSAEVIRLAA